jgi:hypothetical protein
MVPHAEGSSQVLWEDGERVVRRGWRLDDNGKRRAVLTVLPAAACSDPPDIWFARSAKRMSALPCSEAGA